MFAVNVLAEDQAALAALFARPADRQPTSSTACRCATGRTGVPVLGGTLATIECRVQEVVPGGTHRVFLSRVVHAEATEGSPLAYFRGTMGKLEMAPGRRGLRRDPPAGADPTPRAGRGAGRRRRSPNSSGRRLRGLLRPHPAGRREPVVRDPERGHVVRPLSAAESDDAHDAKLVIELGAAELTVGRLTADAARPIRGPGRGDQSAHRGRQARRCGTVHRGQCRVPRLSHPDQRHRCVASGLRATQPVGHDVSGAQQRSGGRSADRSKITGRLVGAYRLGDLADAKRIIMAHNERAKQTQRSGIESRGRDCMTRLR